MSAPYEQSQDFGPFTTQSVMAALFTAAIFAFLPLLQIIPNLFIPKAPPVAPSIVTDIPPVVTEEKPKLEEDPVEIDPPDLKQEVPPLTPREIEMIITPGKGGIRNGSAFIDLKSLIGGMEEIGKLFEQDELEEQPRALFQIAPNYPYALKQQQVEGWAILEWVITDKGNVRSARVIKASHREFQEAALESIMKSKWKPGEVNGKAVNARVRQKIAFTL